MELATASKSYERRLVLLTLFRLLDGRALHVGFGISCNINGDMGPTSYTRDLGKGGVPRVSAANLTMLRKIMRYVHPSTLRFSYVSGEFIVYDATNGPCSQGPPYGVLNAELCNEGYAPTDRPEHTIGLGESFGLHAPGFRATVVGAPAHGATTIIRTNNLRNSTLLQ